MTFEKKFSSLKQKFIKADTSKLPAPFAIQFTMTDEDCGGTFYIANIAGVFSVEPYDYVDNNAAVTAPAAAIAKIASGKVDSALDIFGDSGVVAALAGAYPAPTAKQPAKKPAADKTAKAPAVKPAAKAEAKTPAAKKTAGKPSAK
ncbi:MAG: hypothetical protein ACI4IV_07735 [Acutalibacteraceae bacterium]